MQYGIRNVSLDDISSDLGISKKTIYAHFENKADLVNKVVTLHLQKEEEICERVFAPEANAIEELMEIGNYIRGQLDRLNPVALLELQKFFPEAWDKMEKHRSEFVFQKLLTNIEKGKKQGYYRQDVPARLSVMFYMNGIEHLLQRISISRHSSEISLEYTEFLKYHIFGISSTQGTAFLTELLSKNHPSQK